MSINPGSYHFKLNEEYRNEALNIAKGNIVVPSKRRGKNGTNIFFMPGIDWQKKIIEDITNTFLDMAEYEWFVEVFYCKEPVYYHNDRNIDQGKLCHKGLIIPLEWNASSTVGTIMTNCRHDKKVVYDGNNWREVLTTITNDAKILTDDKFSNMLDTDHFEWKDNSIIFFDSDVLHRASEFTEQDDYKISINALGYK